MNDGKNGIALEADWDADDAEASAEMLERLAPMPEATKQLFRRARGKQKAPTKMLVSLRLDPDVIAHFRAGGDGWQSRINAALRRAAKL